MKSVLIISPYFPPSNAADMQRVRMSLPYFKEMGWHAEVVVVDQQCTDFKKDPLLAHTVPEGTPLHVVKALPKKFTARIGLGSIALRSLPYYYAAVNRILRGRRFDLIYFSTTQFPVCILGAFWKKKFGVPFIIDMQDPWVTDYYLHRPKSERPPKYWFASRLNRYTEPIAMRQCNGLISVSQAYITDLHQRYAHLRQKPAAVIPFGAFAKDVAVAQSHAAPLYFDKTDGRLNLVYIGVSGTFMKQALALLFGAFRRGLQQAPELFERFRFHFIGTSYAPEGKGKQSVLPVATNSGIAGYVSEQTDRVSFYTVLASLQIADGLVIPGSDDPGYTASKIYPYIMSQQPLLGIFHPHSSANDVIRQCAAGSLLSLDSDADTAYHTLAAFLDGVQAGIKPATNWTAFEQFTAREMTRKQCQLFEAVMQ